MNESAALTTTATTLIFVILMGLSAVALDSFAAKVAW